MWLEFGINGIILVEGYGGLTVKDIKKLKK